MELLLRVLFWCPKCWKAIGGWLFSASGFLMLLGWRLAGRVDRIEGRTGIVVDLDKALAGLPLPVPTTPEGFAFAAFCGVLGVSLALAGKWAQRF